MDIKTAFLYGDVEEEIYITPPKGLEHLITPGKVMKLKKAVYGLSQSGRVFYKQLIGQIQGFKSDRISVKSATEDNCIHIIRRGESMIIVATVVDDMFQVTNDPEFLTEFNDYIKERYVCTDNGPVKWFLGIHF